MRFFRGEHYTEDERKAFAESSRVPLVFNKILAPVRTVTGTFLQALFDASFEPVGDEDEEMAEVLSKLATFEASKLDDTLEHGMMATLAYVLGRAYRRNWVDVQPVEVPKSRAEILNPFAVYFDPNSQKVVTREDAEFVDLAHWMGYEQIVREFPQCERDIDQSVLSERARVLGNDFSTTYDKSMDRGHESTETRNGMYKVVERFYRYYRTTHFSVDDDGLVSEVADHQSFKAMFPGARVFKKSGDFLQVAIWAPGLMSGSKKFLYNGEYHSKLRNPDSNRCMWPILEAVSDSVLGETDGFVKALRDPVKMIDVLYTQLVEAAKHSGSGYEQDEGAYANPTEAARAKRLGPHANQRYSMKPGRAGSGMIPIAPQSVPPANTQAMQVADNFLYEASAAPPAMQGLAEGAGTAASLNAQRIEQAGVQLTGFITFFRAYVRQELRVRYAGWREHYTDERVFRITGDDGNKKRIELNKMVPETDASGVPTGGVARINDIKAAEFDVVITDSQSSPTYRQKVLRNISDILQNPSVGANPQLAGPLTEFYFRLSEAPLELKRKVQEATAQAAQPQMQPGMAEQVVQSAQQIPMEA